MSTTNKLREDLDPLVEPLHDNQFLIDLITEVSGDARADVIRRFVSEHHDIGTNVRESLRERGIEPYLWSEDLVAFYAATDAFLYESLVWNRMTMKNDMRRWIGKHLRRGADRPQRILTFGDGLGFDAYYLASLGHEVTYFDVSEKCTQFAKRIFERGELNVEMLSDPSLVPQESYDAVVCLDVLEHVPDPASLVEWLTGLLRARGRLVVHAPFYFLHPSVSTHLRSNRRFSGDVKTLYHPFGLQPIDGRFFWDPLVLEKLRDGESRSSRLPWHAVAGGALLATGRYGVWLHVAVARGLVRADRRRLKSLVEDLAAADSNR